VAVVENKALVQRVLAAYAQSDLEPLLQVIDPNVVWISQGPAQHYAFGGKHVGRAGVLAAMSKLAMDYELHSYNVVELVGEGEVVWMTAQVDFTHRASKQRLAFPIVSRWQIRDGQVRSVTEYYDSASLLLLEGQLEPVVRSA
jgi:ketosteroid isomerase-like protein